MAQEIIPRCRVIGVILHSIGFSPDISPLTMFLAQGETAYIPYVSLSFLMDSNLLTFLLPYQDASNREFLLQGC
jgi:hypothetical protein